MALCNPSRGWDLRPDARHPGQILRDAGCHTFGGGTSAGGAKLERTKGQRAIVNVDDKSLWASRTGASTRNSGAPETTPESTGITRGPPNAWPGG